MQSEPLIPEQRKLRGAPEGPVSEPVAGDFLREDDDSRARDESAQRTDEPQELGTSYLERGQGSESWRRWRQIQANFVDDPRNAVSEAHGLVSELIDGIVAQFQREQRELEGRWSEGDQVSTEDLRLCLQRYRDFFGRLLPARQVEEAYQKSENA
jgi:hypothetical protein